jgi:sec-independent protein translocase protein TatC
MRGQIKRRLVSTVHRRKNQLLAVLGVGHRIWPQDTLLLRCFGMGVRLSQTLERCETSALEARSATGLRGSASLEAATMTDDKEMSLFEHLEELRERLIKSAIALMVTTFVSLLFSTQLIRIILVPAGEVRPVFLRPTEGVLTYFRVALLAGVALALPIITYQVAQFVLPGLKPNEKRFLVLLLPGAVVSFVVGVAFAYFVMLPPSLRFLLSFGSEVAEATWAIGEYIAFVTNLMFWTGVIFEAPLLAFFLAKLGIVTPEMLSSNRKYALLVSAVLAAVITPTPDPFNMMLVMAPLIVLFEISVWVTKLAR